MKTEKTTYQGKPALRRWDGYLTVSAKAATQLTGRKYKAGFERRVLGTNDWISETQYHGKRCFYVLKAPKLW